ncbi:hypothetical protein FRB95_014032 [Tulasnella sp. JGI-2019a]|nr:hypothetical protein FRB95_014032 [Tulasnella sp. JGI-2019a]
MMPMKNLQASYLLLRLSATARFDCSTLLYGLFAKTATKTMVGDLSLDKAHLLGLGVAMLMYGWYFGAFLRVIDGLWAQRERSKVAVWVTISLFVFTTSDLVACVADEYNAWVKYRMTLGVERYFGVDSWAAVREAHYVLMIIASTIAGLFMSWRLYAIWDKNGRIILFPTIILVICVVIELAISIIAIALKDNMRGNDKYGEGFHVFVELISGGFVLANLFSTSLIAARLLWIDGPAAQGRNCCDDVMTSMIQSGALYTVTQLVFTACVVSGYHGAAAFIKYILIIAIATAPLLIVVQLDENNNLTERVDDSRHAHRTGPFGFGAAFRHSCWEDVPPPVGHLILGSIQSVQIKPFRNISDNNDPSRGRSFDSKDRHKSLVTVRSLTGTGNDIRLRLTEDGISEKAGYGRGEDEEPVSPLPSLKFATQMDYSPEDEKSRVKVADPSQLELNETISVEEVKVEVGVDMDVDRNAPR